MSCSYSHTVAARAFEPTEQYAALRERCPVHHEADHEPPFYVLSRFDDVLVVLKDPVAWSNRHGPGVFYQASGVLGTTDNPDHARHRRILQSSFTPAAVDRLRAGVRAIVDGMLDDVLPLGHGDFVELFAAPFPALVIAELLGVDPSERHDFGHHSSIAVDALTGGDVDAYVAAKTVLEAHIARGLDHRDRLNPGDRPDDVLSTIATARRDGALTNREALHLGYQLLVAGHETTTSLLGMLLYRLLTTPALMTALRADPALVPVAVEEAVRFDAPVHGLFRTNPQPADLHGVHMPADSKVQLVYAAANRDPAQFCDPDTFRLDRDPRELGRHLGFGWGVHHCIGAPLARMETCIAMEQLLARTGSITLDGEARRNDSFVLHGLTRLPIRWTAP